MKYLALIGFLALASCATEYQPQSFTGGYSEFKVAPDTATVTFNGNGYTSGQRAAQMAILRCADLTLQSGYRYFTALSAGSGFSNSSFTTPGFATTNVYGYGNYATVNTFITPPRTYNIQKPVLPSQSEWPCCKNVIQEIVWQRQRAGPGQLR